MPRDPARIDPLLDELRAFWHRHPDMRLGQIVYQAAKAGNSRTEVQLAEDTVVLNGLRWINLMTK